MQEAKLSKEKSSAAAAAATEAVQSAERTSSEEEDAVRKLERKIFAAAEDFAASASSAGEKFYFVEAAWHAQWRRWLSTSLSDASAVRPGCVSNLLLLSGDERSPRSGLAYGRDYRVLSPRVWADIVDVYGADATIVRSTHEL